MLVVTRKVSESIMIGEDIEIIVTEIGAERVKIGIKAPRGIPILRKELLETRNLNREASTASCRDAVDQLKKLLEQRTVSADTTRRVVPADKSRDKLTNK